jgi:hypothetical protein
MEGKVKITEYKIDDYSVEIYSSDLKGARTRWGEKIIRLYSGGREVAQAVFAREGAELPEPYLSGGKIFYFAPGSQFPDVIGLLRSEKAVFIVWKPISDPQEDNDGDAYFRTAPADRETD